MASLRDPDPLTKFTAQEHARVLECIDKFAAGARSAVLGAAREIVRAFDAAEKQILFPMLSRVRLSPERQHLLADVQNDRANHLAELDALSHKRAKHVRKVAAVRLAALLRFDLEQRLQPLIATLASQLPRLQFRALAQAFVRWYAAARDAAAQHAA